MAIGYKNILMSLHYLSSFSCLGWNGNRIGQGHTHVNTLKEVDEMCYVNTHYFVFHFSNMER